MQTSTLLVLALCAAYVAYVALAAQVYAGVSTVDGTQIFVAKILNNFF